MPGAGAQYTSDLRVRSVLNWRWLRLALALGGRAVLNPRVAVDLLALVWAFRSRGWYLRPPFLPVPSGEYLQWRMHTAYGDHAAAPSASEVVRFARWRRKLLGL